MPIGKISAYPQAQISATADIGDLPEADQHAKSLHVATETSEIGSGSKIRYDNREILNDNREIRDDNREIRNDSGEIRGDNREIRDINREIRNDNREIRDDNREIRTDDRKIRDVNREIRNDKREFSREGGVVSGRGYVDADKGRVVSARSESVDNSKTGSKPGRLSYTSTVIEERIFQEIKDNEAREKEFKFIRELSSSSNQKASKSNSGSATPTGFDIVVSDVKTSETTSVKTVGISNAKNGAETTYTKTIEIEKANPNKGNTFHINVAAKQECKLANVNIDKANVNVITVEKPNGNVAYVITRNNTNTKDVAHNNTNTKDVGLNITNTKYVTLNKIDTKYVTINNTNTKDVTLNNTNTKNVAHNDTNTKDEALNNTNTKDVARNESNTKDVTRNITNTKDVAHNNINTKEVAHNSTNTKDFAYNNTNTKDGTHNDTNTEYVTINNTNTNDVALNNTDTIYVTLNNTNTKDRVHNDTNTKDVAHNDTNTKDAALNDTNTKDVAANSPTIAVYTSKREIKIGKSIDNQIGDDKRYKDKSTVIKIHKNEINDADDDNDDDDDNDADDDNDDDDAEKKIKIKSNEFVKNKVQPLEDYESIQEDKTVFRPLAESTIDLEVRVARERENDLKASRGQFGSRISGGGWKTQQSEEKIVVVTPATLKSTNEANFGHHDDEAFKKISENRFKAEMQREKERELDLLKEGKIKSMSWIESNPTKPTDDKISVKTELENELALLKGLNKTKKIKIEVENIGGHSSKFGPAEFRMEKEVEEDNKKEQELRKLKESLNQDKTLVITTNTTTSNNVQKPFETGTYDKHDDTKSYTKQTNVIVVNKEDKENNTAAVPVAFDFLKTNNKTVVISSDNINSNSPVETIVAKKPNENAVAVELGDENGNICIKKYIKSGNADIEVVAAKTVRVEKGEKSAGKDSGTANGETIAAHVNSDGNENGNIGIKKDIKSSNADIEVRAAKSVRAEKSDKSAGKYFCASAANGKTFGALFHGNVEIANGGNAKATVSVGDTGNRNSGRKVGKLSIIEKWEKVKEDGAPILYIPE